MPECGKEKRLWTERGRLEEMIERKEKMIHNAQERLSKKADFLWHEDRDKLVNDVKTMQSEINRVREEITAVDEEIRVGESSNWWEAIRDEEEAKTIVAAAKQAEEISHALGEARQRMRAEEQNISELEAKLKEVGQV